MNKIREILREELKSILNEAPITIDRVNYFSELGDYGNDYNAKVLYRKDSKLYLAHVFIDFFNKRVQKSKQPREGKVLAGLDAAINSYAKKVNWFF